METWVVAFILTFLGLFLSAYLIWYYFLTPRKPVKAMVSKDGVQRVHVEVRNGYHPNIITAQAGRRLDMRFYRIEDAPCSEEIILKDFGVRKHLPAFRTTSVEITPFQPGEYTFSCGNRIQKGTLIVQS
jgi:plastocyanin domain-containing protein